tara:strand:- start:613 stop:750 length:138 start_codon:yes stop_codon:yes gene_type:complete
MDMDHVPVTDVITIKVLAVVFTIVKLLVQLQDVLTLYVLLVYTAA